MCGSITEEELRWILQNNPHIRNFVETGTYKAQSAITSSKYFNRVYTVELSPTLYEESCANIREAKVNNIVAVRGDSMETLPLFVDKLRDELGSVMFFIDAHISGHDSTCNGIPVPLLEEIEIIFKKCQDLGKSLKGSIFVIDDVRLWKIYKYWGNITDEKILDTFKKYNIEVKRTHELNDRFYIYL